VPIKCAGNFHARKHVKFHIKIMYSFSTFLVSKYLCIIAYTCEKPPPP
jgi:hypothetical protein